MNLSHALPISLFALFLVGGCASRPVNPPITQADPRTGYRFEARQAEVKNKQRMKRPLSLIRQWLLNLELTFSPRLLP